MIKLRKSVKPNTTKFGPVVSRRLLASLAAQARGVRLFWVGLVLSPLIWLLFTFSALLSLRLRWLLVCILAEGLSCANLYGYLRCQLAAGESAVNSTSGTGESGLTESWQLSLASQAIRQLRTVLLPNKSDSINKMSIPQDLATGIPQPNSSESSVPSTI